MFKKTQLLTLMILLLFTFSTGVSAEVKTAEQILNEVTARVNSVTDPNDAEMQFGAAIIADPITNNVLYEYNADKKMYPASITKLMSFVILYEGLNAGTYHFDDIVTISPNVEAIEMGDIGYLAGESRTLGELLQAMEVISANDAAVAVAEYVAGSEAAFAELMNEKAEKLGMTNTHFVNASGLHDDNHYSTARDLLKLADYACTLDGLLTLTSTKTLTFTVSTGTKTVNTTNKLLEWYQGADGLKTGFTTPAGRCLVATAARNGLRLNSVVLGGTSDYSHYTESMILLNYGFANMKIADALVAQESTTTLFLPKGKTEELKVAAKETVTLPTKNGTDPGYTIDYSLNEEVIAPVVKGETVGVAKVVANGETIATTDLIAAESAEEQNFFQAFIRFFRDLFDKE